MAKTVERLSDVRIRNATKPGLYPDGAGLCLQVRGANSRSWVYRYTLRGRAREMGLGSYPEITLEAARTQAEDYRRLRIAGRDPIETRNTAEADARLVDAKAVTFVECTRQYIAAHKAGWRNKKHADQWERTLEVYAEPILGALSVQAIDTGLVLEVLEKIWSTKPETANRVRGRIELILDWAKVRGYRAGDNPARWRGHLDKMLPKRSKVRQVKHHAALPYSEIPKFMAALRNQDNVAGRALEFIVLTAARTSEALGAVPAEIAEHDKIWTIPAARMKAAKEHRVPLPTRALEVLKLVPRESGAAHLFPGLRRDKALTDAALHALLARMGRDDVTVHGFRSTFRDWASEQTGFPNEVMEMALAHTISDKTEAAYRRGDLFDKRRKLMEAWSSYCASSPAEKGQVVPMKNRSGQRGN